ncbi:MAG: FAD-dependent monooxygenase [Gloeomargarita sp. SKYBB_i_bin120]|nr:FAD-dependent monooxygenase [Gloeomargarita sp. SKYG98]MCS7293486.1 FAD-dependent monooxygenase [Gloeomargarita sp. SKYB120]MDW8179052.1 FAD-dependent monooxygenase [Gloeomargarita sp. SKYBB_i_bin120]
MANAAAGSGTWDYDVLIVGGSLVGLTLAAWLGPEGIRVLVVEAQSNGAGTAARVYALMPLTEQVWQRVGVWSRLQPVVQSYDRIHLTDQGRYPIVFTPADLGGRPSLGSVGEQQRLWPVFREFIAQTPNVTYWEGTQLVDFVVTPTEVKVKLSRQGELVCSCVGLIVGADGAQSLVRQEAGIPTWSWPYWQSCVTTVLYAEEPPVAYERFWPAGPLALLPLPHQRWGVVWTLPHREAQRLLRAPTAEFLAELRPYLPFTQVTEVGERHCFAVEWRQAQRYVQPRLVLVGDAAHRCHPVGGQGMNLGIRDVATLGEVLVTAHRRGEDIGQLSVLRRYQRWRWFQVCLSLLFTDALNRVFSQGWEPLVTLRALVLQTMQRVGFLRRWSLHFMAGLWGQLPAALVEQPANR